MYQLLTLVISAIRMVLKLDDNSFQSVDQAAGTAADITSRQIASETGSERRQQMAESGVDWGKWDRSEASFHVANSHLLALKPEQLNFYGPLQVESGNQKVMLFDCGFHIGERQKVLAPILQTVASCHAQDLKAPSFYLRPVVSSSAVYSNFLSCYDKVDSMSAHSFNVLIESQTPGAVIDLFDTKTAFTELLPFVQQYELTVEWTGDALLVYRMHQTLDAGQMSEFAGYATTIADHLRNAATESVTALECKL